MPSGLEQQVPSADLPEDRVWAAAAHLSALLAVAVPWPGMNIVGSLVIWLAHRDRSPFVEHQARAALNFQIGMAILMLANVPLVFVAIGIVIAWAIVLINMVFVLLATLTAAGGKGYVYPFSLHLVPPRARCE